MEKIELVKSEVTFLPVEHKYFTPDGKELSGVTTLLKKHIFKDMYKDIPKHILKRAAEHGHKVHSDIESIDTLGFEPITDEGDEYLILRQDYTPIANEYLISNMVSVASSIDCVWQDKDGNIILADIKTTSELILHYLEWQLSVYAYLFELQNPGLKVHKLFVVWLPDARYGKPTLKEIERIDDLEVRNLLICEEHGMDYYEPKHLTIQNDLPVEYKDLEDALINIVEVKKQAEAREKEFKERMLAMMMENNVKKWESERISITVKDAYEKETFDSKTFKADHPELSAQYTKTSICKESLLIKLKS
jgi:hypothetical protein